MNLEEVKYMERRCAHQLIAFGQQHGLQHVDGLGNIGHLDAVAVIVEDI